MFDVSHNSSGVSRLFREAMPLTSDFHPLKTTGGPA